VGAAAVLFAGFGSTSVAVTVTKLVNVPRTLGKAVMVIVALAPLARVPSGQVIGVAPTGGEQLPWLGVSVSTATSASGMDAV
jgi:hypothetical protein